MRPLDVIMGLNFSILPSIGDKKEAFRRQWIIREKFPTMEATYVYAVSSEDKTKFYENGFIYEADGSLADNELINRVFYFHNFRHASLNKLLECTVDPVYPNNFMYSLPAGDLSNLKVIASVRDRLSIPDWLALLIVNEIVKEDAVLSLLGEIPDLFETYSSDWILRVLKITASQVNKLDDADAARLGVTFPKRNVFEDFCKVIELEKTASSFNIKI